VDIKKYNMHLLLEAIGNIKPKLVKTTPPSYLDGGKKAWTVMVGRQRVGEIVQIDTKQRAGGSFTSGWRRVKGYRCFVGSTPFGEQVGTRYSLLRTKLEAVEWFMNEFDTSGEV
jgi:hypothetical protein